MNINFTRFFVELMHKSLFLSNIFVSLSSYTYVLLKLHILLIYLRYYIFRIHIKVYSSYTNDKVRCLHRGPLLEGPLSCWPQCPGTEKSSEGPTV